MIRRRLGVHLVLTVALTAVAVSSLSSNVAFGQEWAEKMFSEKKHDFGVVARAAKTEHRFVIHNLYVEDVHIASVRSSCGCTTPRIENPYLKTHEEGAIVAHVNSDRFLGKKGATLTVTIDKPFRAEVQLQVSSYIRSDVVFEPGAVEIGSVAAGTPIEKTVDLKYHGGSDWRITEIKTTNPHISAEATPVTNQYGQVQYKINVRVDEDQPAGYVSDQIVLVTNDYQRTQIPLMVEGVFQAPIVVSPSPLRLGVVETGDHVTRSLVIRGDKPFKIKSIKAADPRFEFGQVDTLAKAIHTVPVTFTADAASGQVSDMIHIETDVNSQDLATTVIITPPGM